MSAAPFDRYLRSLEPTDTEADRLRKLLQNYNLRKEGGHFVTVRKQDPDPDLDDDDLDDIVDSIDERADGDGSRSEGSGTSRHISHLADLVSEATGVERQASLDWLLHSSRGLALVRRTLGKQKETPMPDSLSKIIDDHGLINVAKSIASGGSTGGATEHSLTAAIEVLAKRLYPTLSSAQAFAKFFSADTPESLACRQAIQKLKRHPVAEAAPRAAAGGTAYGELMRKAEALRKREPSLSREMAFAKAYSSPENVELVKRERAENRPQA